MDIQRFDPDYDAELDQVIMEENEDGCTVNYSEYLDLKENLIAAEKELQECAQLLGEMQVSEHKKHLELESLRAKIKEAQEPIYLWRLEDDGWMECTKEWFDAAISAGYEKRIVYAAPIIPD